MWQIGMILTTVLTGLLIIISVSMDSKPLNFGTKILKYLAQISYEIYLIQYPIIYIFQDLDLTYPLKLAIMLSLILVISIIYNMALNGKHKILKYPLLISLTVLTFMGGYKYVIAKDYTAEMQALEEELTKNAEILEIKQAEFKKAQAENEETWNKAIADLEAGKENLSEVVTNLQITGVGDSVMLGAINNLYQTNPFATTI